MHCPPESVDPAAAVVGGTVVETSINVGEHAFAHMEEDVDRQRLLGGSQPPFAADPATQALTTDLQKKER